MTNIFKIIHLPSVVQSEYYEAITIIFVRKENKKINYSTICLIRFSVAPFWRISAELALLLRSQYALLCQPRHTDKSSTFVYALI